MPGISLSTAFKALSSSRHEPPVVKYRQTESRTSWRRSRAPSWAGVGAWSSTTSALAGSGRPVTLASSNGLNGTPPK